MIDYKIMLIQQALRAWGSYHDELDGEWGPNTEAAYQQFVAQMTPQNGWRAVKASSFADPADVRAFNRCKQEGKSDYDCFKVGDNGIGKWGHNTAQEDQPMAAIPRDVWTKENKKGGAPIEVRYHGEIVKGILGDTLPATQNIHNGAGIDLNPAFAKQFNLKPPFMTEVEWRWA